MVRQRLPYVGHVAGLFLHGMKYFEFTRYVTVRTPWASTNPLFMRSAPNVEHPLTP